MLTEQTTLIVGPVSLIKQWESEIDHKLKPGHKLRVFVLHGKKATFEEMRTYDVVLTTYGKIAQEFKRYQSAQEKNSARDEVAKLCPVLCDYHQWHRVILDEAQCIKNKDTQSSKAAHQITATYRWCLTGTPLMNSIIELYPLLRFLRVRPYNDHKKFMNVSFSLAVAFI